MREGIPEGKLDTIDTVVDTIETHAAAVDTLTKASGDGDLAAVKTKVAAIDTLTKASGGGDLAAIKTKTDNLPADPAGLTSLSAILDGLIKFTALFISTTTGDGANDGSTIVDTGLNALNTGGIELSPRYVILLSGAYKYAVAPSTNFDNDTSALSAAFGHKIVAGTIYALGIGTYSLMT